MRSFFLIKAILEPYIKYTTPKIIEKKYL